jgi:hypothetical protein
VTTAPAIEGRKDVAEQAAATLKLGGFSPLSVTALRKIAAAGPETDPHDDEDYDDQEGAYGAGIDAANWECASIARAALAAAERTT